MELINHLSFLGLSKYEAEVYCALVKIGRTKVRDLAKVTSVPRSQIYPSLKKLANKGICTENKGEINYYSAVAPMVAFHNILQKEKEVLQELNKAYKNQGKTEVPYEFIQVLKGRQIREFITKAVNDAKREVLMFTKYFSEKDEKTMEDAVNLEIKTLKKGVKNRCLYETGCLNDSKYLSYVKKALNHGEVGRVINFLPMNMIIFDDKATFSLSHKEDKNVTVFIFNHPSLISSMKNNFEYLWSKGTDINKVLTKDKE